MGTDVRERVPLELAAAALVAAAALPLSRLVREEVFFSLVLPSLALSVTAAWGWRLLRLPLMLSAGLSILTLMWYAAALFALDTFWGPFPTMESMAHLAELIRAGGVVVVEDIAPVTLSEGVRLFIIGGVWLTATVVDIAIVRGRSPLLGITLAIPMFVIPGALLEGERRWLEMLLFVGASMLLLFLDERSRAYGWGAIMGRSRPGWRTAPALAVGTVGALLVVALMPLIPGYGAPPGLQGFGGGNRVVFNPLVAIKPTLDRSPHRVLFTVRSSRPSYYRLTALDEFESEVWRERSRREETPIGAEAIPPVSPAAGSQFRQEIRIDALAGSWLPAAYEPVSVHDVLGSKIQTEPRSLVIDRPLERGMRYVVFSRPPNIDATVLDGPIAYDTRALAPYLELPDQVRNDLEPIARQIVGGQTSPFRQARRLQNYLRTFTYDEDVAAGHSYTTILEFLTESQRGYCEQFAASMAVLARTLGIPSRVVIGFAGGDVTRTGVYSVTTEYAHAWVEVFFPQAGWIPFEPTPRAGITRVPAYALPDALSPQPGDDPVQPDVQDPPVPTDPDDPQDPGGGLEPGAGPGLVGGRLPGWLIPIIVVALFASAPVLVAWVLARRRRARVRRAPTKRDAFAERYVDFLAWCAAAGYGREPGETPAEHARRIGRMVPAAREPFAHLASTIGYALWAPPNGLDPADLERAIAETQAPLEDTLPRYRRALAVLGWGRWRA